MREKRTQEKNKGAKTNSLATIYTVALIIVAFAVILISSLLLPTMRIVGVQPEGTPPFMEEARRSSSTDLNSYFTLRIVLSVLNTILVVYLLFVYVRNYLVLKSSFTLGIVAFLFSFLLYALSSIPLVHMLFGPFRISEVFSFVPMLFSAIGLIIFAKLSNE